MPLYLDALQNDGKLSYLMIESKAESMILRCICGCCCKHESNLYLVGAELEHVIC